MRVVDFVGEVGSQLKRDLADVRRTGASPERTCSVTMTIAIRDIMVSSEGVSVDLVIWQTYRRPMSGLLEQTLEINPGLAGLGPILPVGTRFGLPIVRLPVAPVREVVHLWS
jgi:phage tail protein X